MSSKKILTTTKYRLKDLLNGPKIKPSEPTCKNDPVTGEIITEREDIKGKSLEHCVKVLSKNEAREEDAEKILGDWIHEKGCRASISETVKVRTTGLRQVRQKKLFKCQNRQ